MNIQKNPHGTHPPLYRIISSHQPLLVYLKEMISYRELFFFLVWRDILVRYKQTALGIIWAVIRPIITMIVFTCIFQKIAKFPSGNAPYPLFILAALLPWQFFSDSLMFGTNSLLLNEQLISKIYFPRMLIPLSSIVSFIVDFLISLVMLLLCIVSTHSLFSYVRLLCLFFFVIWGFIFSAALTLLFSALIVRYRDIRYAVPFLIQCGLYISPVGFASHLVPPPWRTLYSLNPMVAIIDGLRWCFFNEVLYIPAFIVGAIMTFFLLIMSAFSFRNAEKTFADVI